MRGQRRNIIFLAIYIALAIILILTLIYFIWQTQQTREQKIEQTNLIPQVERYFIHATIDQVHVSARALVVNYNDENGIIVGLLPEAKILNQNNQEVSLTDLQIGQKIKIEVKFVGTNSILADNIYLEY